MTIGFTADGRRLQAVEISPGVDSTGAGLPANFEQLAQALAYDGSGNLSTVTVTSGGSTWVQTLTYTSGNLTGVSAWVKQ